MTATTNLILVTGATGKQGGAVARELLAKGFRVRAMTRKPESPPAQALEQAGAEVVFGDLDDDASLRRALAGVWGVFAVQNTWEAGVEHEEEQGKRLATLARESGVQHFVYSSVGSAHKGTGIPHFDNKHRVEETVRALGFPSHVILRPVFFMENLLSPWFLQGQKIVAALEPTTVLQMIAVADIGRYGALAFERATELAGAEIDLAGDALTLPAAAEILGRSRGERLAFQQIPIAAVRENSEDFALMLEWFEREGYSADIEGNARRYRIEPTRLRDWAASEVERAAA